MRVLSGSTLADALSYCSCNSSKVAVVFSNRNQLYEFRAELLRQVESNSLPGVAHYNRGRDELRFYSGGYIKLLSASYNRALTGWTFHEVIYDRGITDTDTLSILKAIERPPSPNWFRRTTDIEEMEVDPEPLDAFLSEFSVHKT